MEIFCFVLSSSHVFAIVHAALNTVGALMIMFLPNLQHTQTAK